MRAIRVLFDDELLREIDATDEVRRGGRSAFLRRAAAEHLHRHRESQITDLYRQAYAPGRQLGVKGDEFEGWEEQGEWPADSSAPAPLIPETR